MARSSKTPVILVMLLLVVISVVAYMAYSKFEGFRSVDCAGVSCPEGQFCQQNTCKSISAPTTNTYTANEDVA